MEFFYDGQIRRYITQFIRLMSNFSYKDARGNVIQVPVTFLILHHLLPAISKALTLHEIVFRILPMWASCTLEKDSLAT